MQGYYRYMCLIAAHYSCDTQRLNDEQYAFIMCMCAVKRLCSKELPAVSSRGKALPVRDVFTILTTGWVGWFHLQVFNNVELILSCLFLILVAS